MDLGSSERREGRAVLASGTKDQWPGTRSYWVTWRNRCTQRSAAGLSKSVGLIPGFDGFASGGWESRFALLARRRGHRARAAGVGLRARLEVRVDRVQQTVDVAT